MREDAINICGAVTCWVLAGESSRQTLVADMPGQLVDLVPEPRTHYAALRYALVDVCQGQRRLIRPLESRGGFSVVTETADGDRLAYTQDIIALVSDSGRLTITPSGHADGGSVEHSYQRALGTVSSQAVGEMLAQAVNRLGGVPLRDHGGVYWVPEPSLEAWAAVVRAVERAGTGSLVSLVRTAMDERGIKSVVAALQADVNGDLARIEREIAEGDLGQRGCRNRADEAAALASKVARYEGLLGVTLDQLRATASQVEANAAVAAMAAMGGSDKQGSLL